MRADALLQSLTVMLLGWLALAVFLAPTARAQQTYLVAFHFAVPGVDPSWIPPEVFNARLRITPVDSFTVAADYSIEAARRGIQLPRGTYDATLILQNRLSATARFRSPVRYGNHVSLQVAPSHFRARLSVELCPNLRPANWTLNGLDDSTEFSGFQRTVYDSPILSPGSYQISATLPSGEIRVTQLLLFPDRRREDILLQFGPNFSIVFPSFDLFDNFTEDVALIVRSIDNQYFSDRRINYTLQSQEVCIDPGRYTVLHSFGNGANNEYEIREFDFKSYSDKNYLVLDPAYIIILPEIFKTLDVLLYKLDAEGNRIHAVVLDPSNRHLSVPPGRYQLSRAIGTRCALFETRFDRSHTVEPDSFEPC